MNILYKVCFPNSVCFDLSNYFMWIWEFLFSPYFLRWCVVVPNEVCDIVTLLRAVCSFLYMQSVGLLWRSPARRKCWRDNFWDSFLWICISYSTFLNFQIKHLTKMFELQKLSISLYVRHINKGLDFQNAEFITPVKWCKAANAFIYWQTLLLGLGASGDLKNLVYFFWWCRIANYIWSSSSHT